MIRFANQLRTIAMIICKNQKTVWDFLKKVYLFFIITLVGVSYSPHFFTQTNLDSLYAIWQDNTQDDSTRVKAYADYIYDTYTDTALIMVKDLHAYALDRNYPKAQVIGYHIQGRAWSLKGDYLQALDFFNKSLKIAEQISDQSGIARSLNGIGFVYQNQGDYPQALEYYGKSLKIAEQIGDQSGIAKTLVDIGVIYKNQSDYPQALEYYNKSLKIAEQISNLEGISNCFHNIGVIYHIQGDYHKALEYYTKRLKIKEQTGDLTEMANTYNNMGLAYQSLEDYTGALNYFVKALKINEQNGDQRGMAASYNNMALIYESQDDYSKARDNYLKSLKVARQIGFQKGIAVYLHNIGGTYESQKNYGKARDYYDQGYQHAKTMGVLEDQKLCCNRLYLAYKAMDNSNKALNYLELLRGIEDSLKTKETAKKLQQMEFEKEQLADSLQYAAEIQQKSGEIERKEITQRKDAKIKKQLTLLVIGSSLLLSTIILLLFYRNRAKKRQIALNEAIINTQQLNEKVLKDKLTYFKERLIKESEQGLVQQKPVKDYSALSEQLKEDNNWRDFIMEFNRTYNGLLDALRHHYPQLTNHDIRMASLTFLGLELKEIGGLLAVTKAGVTKAKSRLRDRLGLEKSGQIVPFLEDFKKKYC